MAKFNKILIALIFISVFILLGLFASQLGLYLDDANLIFPSITKTYSSHVFQYIKDNGFFRPLGLFYYYFIFTFYLFSSKLAHVFPLLLTVGVSGLVYLILRIQSINKINALLCSVLILAFPFWPEAYGWLSANVSVLVIFISFLQIFLLSRYSFSRKILMAVFLLQVISAFLYESVIFIPVALGFYWAAKSIKPFNFRGFLAKLAGSSLLLSIPGITYLVINWGLASKSQTRLHPENILNVSENLGNQFIQLKKLLFWQEGRDFFASTLHEGLNRILENPLAIILFLILVVGLVILILGQKDEKKEDNNTNTRIYFVFWFICLVLSLLPLSLQQSYLPFRLFILPIIFLSIIIFTAFDRLIGRVLRFACVFIIMLGILTQIGLINNYRQQYSLDLKMVKEIAQKTTLLGFSSGHRTNIYVQNLPDNFTGAYVYGDYLYTMFHYPWSMEAFIDLNSGNIKYSASGFTNGHLFISNHKKEFFLEQRPLTIFSYTDNSRCLSNECLELVNIFE